MLPNIKRVAAIHDMSGFGRASLTTIIPVLSTMGVQVCPVPTAILSTHSGGFTDYSFLDLTDNMIPLTNHWKKLKLEFDCIYSGFLGSPKQVEIVESIIKDFKTKDTLVVVDPVMGDNGNLYNSINVEMISQMQRLIKSADIIVPNFTEAAFLLNENPKELITKTEVKCWLKKLADMGPETVIITSVPDTENNKMLSVLSYEKNTDTYWKISSNKIDEFYPGTGDLFTSVMIGNLLHGENLPVSIDKSVSFVSQCIKASRGYDYPNRDGVLLEKELPYLNSNYYISNYDMY